MLDTYPDIVLRRSFLALPFFLATLAIPGTVVHAQETDPRAPPPARTATPQSQPEEASPAGPSTLESRIEARIEASDRRTTAALHQLDEDAFARAKVQAMVQAEEAGFGITSPDGRFRVRMHGQLQVDGRRFFGDDSLKNLDTFLVRRARPTIEVTLLGLADALITPDFAGGTAQLFDAYIDLHPRPWLRLRAGKFKPPIGLERLQSDNSLVFTERALDQDLSAQRDVGVQLWGDIAGGLVRYEVAILNGVPDSALNDVDSDYAKSVAGRVFVQPFVSPTLRRLGRLGVGFAAESGNEKGSTTISNGAVTSTGLGSFKSTGQNTIFTYLTSTTDPTQTVIALHRHTRLNPQLYYYLGSLGLEAEYLRERQGVDKGGVSSTVINSAGHVTLAYVVGGDCSYEGPRVRNPVSFDGGAFGVLEIGARYHWLTVDAAAFPALADASGAVAKAKGFGLVLSWYLSQSLRLAASYDQTAFRGGAKNGSSTANRTTEKVFIGRMQVGY